MRGIIRELRASEIADVTVLDLEAGLENLKRGTPGSSDGLLAVAEPYWRSLETAANVAEMARQLEIPLVGVVANKVRDDRDEEWVRQVFEPRGFDVLAVVPWDQNVSTADRKPGALIDVDPAAPAVKAVEKLADKLEELETAVSRSG